MNRRPTCASLGLAIAWFVCLGATPVLAQFHHASHGSAHRALGHSPSYVTAAARPAGIQITTGFSSSESYFGSTYVSSYRHSHYYGGYNPGIYLGGSPFYFGSPFYYGPYAAPYYLGSPYSPFPLGPYFLPPVLAPAVGFGPQAALQFMGADPAPVGARGARPLNFGPPLRAPVVQKPQAKVSNAEARGRASKFLGFGDTHFAEQKFHNALQRYRDASQAAPDLGEPRVREGFAMVAMGQYESAVKELRRGLSLIPNWQDADIRLDAVYGPNNNIAKNAHLEALAQAVDARALDGDLLMLLGLELYFDGQRDRARPLLERAAKLGANADHLLDSLIPPPAAAAPAKKAGAEI